ncbi:hypothetical protein QJQ45_028499 [Haematococcus lacustris]|nr:hypothetical protein QJQ45_028499 [Haematococcus lacustris]
MGGGLAGRACNHCATLVTPCWRRGPAEKPILCNACGTRYLVRGSLEGYMPGSRSAPDKGNRSVCKPGNKRKAHNQAWLDACTPAPLLSPQTMFICQQMQQPLPTTDAIPPCATFSAQVGISHKRGSYDSTAATGDITPLGLSPYRLSQSRHATDTGHMAQPHGQRSRLELHLGIPHHITTPQQPAQPSWSGNSGAGSASDEAGEELSFQADARLVSSCPVPACAGAPPLPSQAMGQPAQFTQTRLLSRERSLAAAGSAQPLADNQYVLRPVAAVSQSEAGVQLPQPWSQHPLRVSPEVQALLLQQQQQQQHLLEVLQLQQRLQEQQMQQARQAPSRTISTRRTSAGTQPHAKPVQPGTCEEAAPQPRAEVQRRPRKQARPTPCS